MENRPTEIIVHHDGVSRSGPSFDIINEYHKGREFPLSSLGFYVGYTWWIERDGKMLRARADNEEQAHTKGENFRSIGIGLAGNFDVEDPTPEQVVSLRVLLQHYCSLYNIPAERIYPHRHFAAKTCYGSRLPDWWAAVEYLRSEVERLTALIASMDQNGERASTLPPPGPTL